MLIKYKSVSCGPDGSFQPGDTRTVPDAIGVELVVGGYAENITPRERAIAPAREQAVAPAQPVIPQPQPARNAPKRGR